MRWIPIRRPQAPRRQKLVLAQKTQHALAADSEPAIRSCSYKWAIQPALVSFPTWRDREATSPGSPTLGSNSPGSVWSFSEK
jgi:hypothetical protein